MADSGINRGCKPDGARVKPCFLICKKFLVGLHAERFSYELVNKRSLRLPSLRCAMMVFHFLLVLYGSGMAGYVKKASKKDVVP